MSETARPPFVVAHLLCSSPQARRRLIVERADALGEWASPWFVADLMRHVSGSVMPVLEVAARPVDARSSRAEVEGLMYSWQADGFCSIASKEDRPWVLSPHLFPGGIVPTMYPSALSAGSTRAVSILREVRSPSIDGLPDQVVREEIDVTYRSFVPDVGERADALRSYAGWLERVLARRGLAPATTPEASPARSSPSARPSRAAAYEALRGPMEQELARNQARIHDPTVSRSASIRAILLARLTHTQAVRLRGPYARSALGREAAIVRALARSILDEDDTPTDRDRLRRTSVGPVARMPRREEVGDDDG
jgi:hypothetical protein